MPWQPPLLRSRSRSPPQPSFVARSPFNAGRHLQQHRRRRPGSVDCRVALARAIYPRRLPRRRFDDHRPSSRRTGERHERRVDAWLPSTPASCRPLNNGRRGTSGAFRPAGGAKVEYELQYLCMKSFVFMHATHVSPPPPPNNCSNCRTWPVNTPLRLQQPETPFLASLGECASPDFPAAHPQTGWLYCAGLHSPPQVTPTS